MLTKLSKLSITMMVAYPLIAYISLWVKQPLFIISYLMLILLLLGIEKCRNQHWYSGIAFLSSIILISYFIQQSYIQYLLFLPPNIILFSLFILFSQSLAVGQIPLISQYAKLLGDKLEDRHLRYNRLLTIIWSGFFLLMLTISILLIAFSSMDAWSLFTHIISYLLIASFFIIEFIYRKHHFAGEIEGGFFQFIKKIIKIRPTNLHHK
jgi:uncharacterized membrane protein